MAINEAAQSSSSPQLAGYGRVDYPTGKPSNEMERRKYAQYVRALWDEQEDEYRDLRQVWIQNLLFLSGRQWWVPNRHGVYAPMAVPEWREQPVYNLCLAYFRTFLAKATKIRPAWQVVPASTEPEDVHSSQLAEDVLEAKWIELKLGEALERAVAWTIATGNAFLYPYWNTRTGKIRRLEVEEDVPIFDSQGNLLRTETMMVPCDENGEPYLKPDGSFDLEKDPHIVDEGDVGVRVYSPFQVRVNADAETDEDVNLFIIADVVTIRDAEQRWPDYKNRFTAEDVSEVENYEHTLATAMENPRTGLKTGTMDRRDQHLSKVLVLHYHERPSTDYPNGRYWVCTGDHLLEEPDELPEGVWPALIHLRDVIVPGRYHGSAVLEHVVNINREYNEVNAQIKEHHNLMAKGKWLSPKGSGVKRGAITNMPGEVVEYNIGFKPEQADLKSLPSSIYAERDRILNDFERISGIHKVSMGSAPPGVTAGVAFLQLQEADDTDLGPFLAMLERSVASLAGSVLRIVQERYREERLVYITGKNNRYMVRAFQGSDLTGAIDVVPVAESAFPWSKTARQSMILTLAQTMPQMFQDPETGMFDTAKFARLLPVGGLEHIAGNEDLDIQEALREEEVFSEMMNGEEDLPQPQFWQNHSVHFQQHVRTLKSGEFEDWPEEAKAAFIAHVKQTMEMRDQKSKEAAQMNAIAQGNAPKEVYQQTGNLPPDAAVTGEAGLEPSPDVEGMMAAQPADPAAMEQQAMLTEIDRLTANME